MRARLKSTAQLAQLGYSDEVQLTSQGMRDKDAKRVIGHIKEYKKGLEKKVPKAISKREKRKAKIKELKERMK